MLDDQVLRIVLPLLDGTELAACMTVCKQWRDIARDDYFWKCLCSKRWPSTCKASNPPSLTYYHLYKNFCKRKHKQISVSPKLSFNDLEFFIDIWCEEKLIFSEVAEGALLARNSGLSPVKFSSSPEFKMGLTVEPRINIPLSHTLCVSVLARRKDSNKIASIINRSFFDYIDQSSHRTMAFEFLELSPSYPFMTGVRAWISLLFTQDSDNDMITIFGIEMDFSDVASSTREVLLLLDVLDWK